MKTYKELQEVMSMRDMNKISGGTNAQRKIAQDRQKAREAKNKGFDPKKEVLQDKPGALDKVKPSTPVVADKPGALAKKKPDLRKSQIGKWSQGIKSNPTSITKSKSNKLTEPEVKKVDVKVDEPEKKGGMEGPQGIRPGTTKNVGKGVVDNIKKKKKKPGFVDGVKDELGLGKNLGNRLGKKVTRGIKSVPGKAAGLIKKGLATGKPTSAGTHTSGDLQGLSGRDKGLIS